MFTSRWQNDEQKSTTCRTILLRLRVYDGQKDEHQHERLHHKVKLTSREESEVSDKFPPSGGWNYIISYFFFNKHKNYPRILIFWSVFIHTYAATLIFTHHLYQFYPFSCHQHWPMSHIMKCRQETHPVTHTGAQAHSHTFVGFRKDVNTHVKVFGHHYCSFCTNIPHPSEGRADLICCQSENVENTHIMSFLLPCRRLWTPSCHHRTDTHMKYINLVVLLLICTHF